MIKNYILAIILFIAVGSNGQAFINEDFSDESMPPAGWTIDGYSTNWSISNTATAGGIAPEGMFTYSDVTAVTRLISPIVDLSGYDEITISFAHFYDDYAGAGPKLGLATRSGGGAWNVVWEINPTTNVGPETNYFVIDNEDVGSSDFQFCFYLDGYFYNLDYWYVDNILLFNPLNLDGELANITTPSYVVGETPVTGILKNSIGETEIVNAEISWQVEDGDVHTTFFDGLGLDIGESYEFVCDEPFNFPIGEYNLNVWISKINFVTDDFAGNDMKMKDVAVVSFSDARTPCFEEFTSSTCAPCATFNTSFVPWSETHADEITLIKYQMNWPGSGDPYYTQEGGDRRNYYGVSWVPWLVGDGMFVNTSISDVNSFFNNSISKLAFASAVSSHSIDGTEISFETTVLPYAGFSNYRVHIIVFENVTTENTGNNGETEFHHVMMKMIPDAEGTSVDFEDRVPQTFTGNVDLAGTNVEEFDDLGVIVIVQDHASKFVQQSAYSVEDGVFGVDDNLSDLTVDGTTIEGFAPDELIYNVVLPEGTVEVPVVAGVPFDENAKAIVVPTIELPGTTIIDVFAEDLKTYKRYTVNFTIAVGIEEPLANKVKAYPNPSEGIFNLSGAEDAMINVVDLTGKLVYSIEALKGNSIDLSSLDNGIYLLSARLKDQSVYRKKITLLK